MNTQPQTETKQRYSMRVTRGADVIGEYRFNATEAGVEQLKANVKPEFAYDILSADGIVHTAHAARVDAMRTRLDEAEPTSPCKRYEKLSPDYCCVLPMDHEGDCKGYVESR